MSVSHENAWRMICAAASERALWIKAQNRRLSYSDLEERTRRLAGFAKQRGLAVGDRIVLATVDDEEAALLFAGLVLNGLTAVTIDPEAGADRARALIGQATPELIVLDAELLDRWGMAGDPRVVPIGRAVKQKGLLGQLRRAASEGFVALLEESEAIDPPSSIPRETLAYILFTSGTTNQPKGVCISHRALFAHLATLSGIYGLNRSSIILNTLMLSHADGMIQGPMLSLVNGAQLLRPMKFEVSAIPALLDTVYRARVTHMVAVPTMLSLIVKLVSVGEDAFRGGDFKLMISCGAALEAWLWEAVESKLGASIINVYGLTETVAGGIFAGSVVNAPRPGTIGRPIECEIRIVDESGSEVAAGENGELLMRGDLIMSGYFNAPALTQEVLDNGWLRTGDIATRGEDGLLAISGRKKNIVIRGGYNIHPEEVAEVLAQHPSVNDAVCFGLPDQDWGERLVAVVGSGAATEKELIEFATQRLEPRKVPSRILVVDALPKGRSGKAALPEVRVLFASLEKDPRTSTMNGHNLDAEQRLLGIAERCFRTERSAISLSSSPADLLGWDSMAHMEFVISLEDEFGVKLSPRDVMAIDRLDKALALVSGGSAHRSN